MWMSGFYNYVFPLLIIALMLYFKKKSTPLWYLFAFFAGSTTEQWGFGAIVMILTLLLCSMPQKKTYKSISIHFIPLALCVIGNLTIYLSPATTARIGVTAHTGLSEIITDFSRMAEAFLNEHSGYMVIMACISVFITSGFIFKKSFRLLITGIIPLLLIGFFKVYSLSFLFLLAYIILCTAVLLKEKHTLPGVLLAGMVATLFIMLPTNTFDARITFPPVILMILAALGIIFKSNVKSKIMLPASLLMAVVAALILFPSYKGFYHNHLIEKGNLERIEEAKLTNTLNYNIDYNKDFAMRQMFNDGWFFNSFLSLYDLEDCSVTLDSKDAEFIYHNDENLQIKALYNKGEYYAPMRDLLKVTGGSINTEENIVMTLNGKSLSYIDSAFVYIDSSGNWQYIIADDNKLIDFYTLYIKLSVVNDAFQTNFTTK